MINQTISYFMFLLNLKDIEKEALQWEYLPSEMSSFYIPHPVVFTDIPLLLHAKDSLTSYTYCKLVHLHK
jgi:hypothetical protein